MATSRAGSRAAGRFGMDRTEQEIIQELACFVRRGQAPVVLFPDGIGNFNENQIENDEAFAFLRDFGDEPLGLSRIRFRQDPLGDDAAIDDAAIDDDIVHRLRSSAMSRALSGK
jgi:hypothetical protein